LITGNFLVPHADDRTSRIAGAIRIAALALGVIGQPLSDIAILVGDGGDRAEMIGVEVARRQGLGGQIEEALADHDVADGEIFVLDVRTHVDHGRVLVFAYSARCIVDVDPWSSGVCRVKQSRRQKPFEAPVPAFGLP
jgi:hypothetical protein